MAMFGRKRPAGATMATTNVIPPHPGPDPDGVVRAIPAAMWQGRSGTFLTRLGLAPDDRANRVETPDEVETRMTLARQAEEQRRAALIADLRRQYGRGVVRPSMFLATRSGTGRWPTSCC